MEKLYTVKQVSELMQIHWQTVLDYIRTGKLKAFKMGKGYRIDKKDLEDFIEKGKKRKL